LDPPVKWNLAISDWFISENASNEAAKILMSWADSWEIGFWGTFDVMVYIAAKGTTTKNQLSSAFFVLPAKPRPNWLGRHVSLSYLGHCSGGSVMLNRYVPDFEWRRNAARGAAGSEGNPSLGADGPLRWGDCDAANGVRPACSRRKASALVELLLNHAGRVVIDLDPLRRL